MIKKKKILITGGNGFIGSWLTEMLVGQNDVTIFDNGRRNAFQFLPKNVQKDVSQIKGNILDKKALAQATKNQDIILHLAAIAGASSYEQNPLLTLQVNLQGTINLLDLALLNPPEQIILFSSSEVYGALAQNINENDSTPIGTAYQSRWSYAISKLASDHYGLSAFKTRQLPVTIVRPFNVYGPRQVGEGAISNMLKNALSDKDIVVTGRGSQKRCWCYISDFSQAISLILDKKLSGEIFNIGNPKEYTTILELANLISKLTSAKVIHTAAVKSEIIDRLPNIKKAKQLLGFSPQINLEKGLEKTKVWFEEFGHLLT